MSPSDNLRMSDSVSLTLNLLEDKVNVSDQMVMGDSLLIMEAGIQLFINDSLNLIDIGSVGQRNEIILSVNDFLLFFDTLINVVNTIYSDGFSLVDSLQYSLSIETRCSDSIILTDSVLISLLVVLISSFSDTLNMSDSVSLELSDNKYIRRYLNDVNN